MKTRTHDSTRNSRANDALASMSVRFGGAFLLLALVAGILISTLLYPPAAVGSVIASIALAACLGRIAAGDGGR